MMMMMDRSLRNQDLKRNCNNNNRIKNQDRQKFQNNHAKVKEGERCYSIQFLQFLGDA